MVLLLLLLLLTILGIFLRCFFFGGGCCCWLLLLLLLIRPEQLYKEKDRRQFGHVVHTALVVGVVAVVDAAALLTVVLACF